jgi:rubredoxin
MRHAFRFKVNFTGGIISPGSLLNLLNALEAASITELRFGLRQQALIDVSLKDHDKIVAALRAHDIFYEVNSENFPNILSSYPAEEIFIRDSWVGEGVYKDIFDLFDYMPSLKINISDAGQTFTPFFTGNINWIASSETMHFWYLFVRFPKTNILFPWKDLIYTNEIPRMSRHLEEMLLHRNSFFYENDAWDGELLYKQLRSELPVLSKPVGKPLDLPAFRLPYYEGLNGYGDKYWLGLYQRSELFPVPFLKDLCRVCLDTKAGQFYATPWKSLIIKNIEERNWPLWSLVLNKHRINVRHASNELNWQVEDTNEEGLMIKQAIIRQFDREDVRTSGLCIAVKTQPNSGLFGSVIVKKQFNMIRGKLKPLDKFDILYTEGFNPNAKIYIPFRTGIQKKHIAIYLISLCKYFYEQQGEIQEMKDPPVAQGNQETEIPDEKEIFQCPHCLTIYDGEVGEPENNIAPGALFSGLPETYRCPLCEAEKSEFLSVAPSFHKLQSI